MKYKIAKICKCTTQWSESLYDIAIQIKNITSIPEVFLILAAITLSLFLKGNQ